MYVCVCEQRERWGGFSHGRQVRSRIPQRNHLLGLSMSQQPITVTVCAAAVMVGGGGGGLAHKMEGTSPNHGTLALHKGQKTA